MAAVASTMLKRDEWLDLARKVDWDFSYVTEEEAFPAVAAGKPWLPGAAWRDWDEPYKDGGPDAAHSRVTATSD